jgi:glycosyltransferase involved in cell wall biosynthesis
MSETSETKILHVTECLEGGVGQAISRWIAKSASENTEHYVLGRVRLSDRAIDFSFAGEQTSSLWELVKRYRRLIRTWKPNVVHIHSTKAGIIARVLSPKGATIAYSPHCYSFLMNSYPTPLKKALRLLERVLSIRTDFIVAVSPYEAGIAREISSRACRVILEPNISSPTTSKMGKTLGSSSDKLVIRAVGRYCNQKNPELMKVIVNQLEEQGVAHDFLWIGSPDDDNSMVELPISGWLSQQAVESHIHSASVLLHTAAWEAAVPLVALDAIRLGTPVVMLKRPEYFDILSNGLFETTIEAVDLLRRLADPECQNALNEAQQLEIDSYLSQNATGMLTLLYSNSLTKNVDS